MRGRGAALRVRVCGRFSAMLTTPGLTQAERPAGFKGESDVNSGNVLKDDTAPLRTAYILLHHFTFTDGLPVGFFPSLIRPER